MSFINKYKVLILILLIAIVDILVLSLEGHSFFSQTGKVSLFWFSQGIEDSQQFFDWYTFSHFIHGILFFLGLSYLFKKYLKNNYSAYMVVVAATIESIWEILENSPLIINRYREGALASGYFGDSIFNSLSDLLFMILGFYFTKKFGWKVALVTIIIFELLTLYFIRDNLTLNIIMLLHPFQAISNWQVGA